MRHRWPPARARSRRNWSTPIVRATGRSIHDFEAAQLERLVSVDAERQAGLDAVVARVKLADSTSKTGRVACDSKRSPGAASPTRPGRSRRPAGRSSASAVAAAVFAPAGERETAVPTAAAAIGVHIDVIRAVGEQPEGFHQCEGQRHDAMSVHRGPGPTGRRTITSLENVALRKSVNRWPRLERKPRDRSA